MPLLHSDEARETGPINEEPQKIIFLRALNMSLHIDSLYDVDESLILDTQAMSLQIDSLYDVDESLIVDTPTLPRTSQVSDILMLLMNVHPFMLPHSD